MPFKLYNEPLNEPLKGPLPLAANDDVDEKEALVALKEYEEVIELSAQLEVPCSEPVNEPEKEPVKFPVVEPIVIISSPLGPDFFIKARPSYVFKAISP